MERRRLGSSRPPNRKEPVDLDDVVYGVHAVEEALSASEPLRRLYVGDERKRDPALRKLIDDAKAAGITIRYESRSFFSQFPYRAHQSVVAFGEPFAYIALEEALAARLPGQALFVVLDHITDPHNAGAIIRSAECAGATAVVIPERRAVGVNATVRKSAAGATAHVPIVRVPNVAGALRTMKKAGIWAAGRGRCGRRYPLYRGRSSGRYCARHRRRGRRHLGRRAQRMRLSGEHSDVRLARIAQRLGRRGCSALRSAPATPQRVTGARGFEARATARAGSTRQRRRKLALALAFVWCASGASVAFVPATAAERIIKIGLDLPLSGIDGAASLPARNAVVLAIDEANRRGLPGGGTLALVDLDDAVQGKHNPAQGAQNMRAFIADPDVVAVIGPMNSNVAEAEIPLANAAGLVQISMGATSVELTHLPQALRYRPALPERPTFFRVCASDDLQGAAVARYARKLDVRSAFVIDDNESYGRGLADVFATAFPAAGGTILGREHLTPFALDFQAMLTKVRGTHPDAVFFGGIVSTGGAVLRRQMGDVGLGKIPYLGGDGLASPDFASLAGASANNTYFTLVSPDVFHLPAAKRFLAAYRARFKADPGSYSAGAYAATAVVVAALRQLESNTASGIPSRDAVLRAVAATRGLATPVGPVSFDRQGDLRDPVIGLYRIVDGKATFVRQGAVRP